MSALEHTKKTFTLNTGDKIPAIGLGTWQSKPNEVREAVEAALLAGYRHIDTALAYGNEHEVGQGIRDSGVPREQIWITTKLDNTWHHRVQDGINSSLSSLGVDYVDLYLVHWPSSTDPNDKKKHLPDWDFIKTWEEMQKLPATGKVRNIGVSNFGIKNLERLVELLSVDFARALKDLAAVLNDLNRLGTLGDLPVSLENKSTLRVRFPGCDAGQVERLCDEVGVERGQIFQDEDFDERTGAELALLFPFAPSISPSPEAELFTIHENPRVPAKHDLDWRLMMSGQTSPGMSNDTNQISFEDVEMFGNNPWISSPSGFSSVGVSELGDREFFAELSHPPGGDSYSDYEGVQGIYKFLEQCDLAAGQRF
ncbi:hypothetical protein TCE0_042r14466 [Talaromyces pinophilus]|uniref:D-xylose reductase [NAD(P)H] n=1 Tax=Talaromyces pinophilus TaxID=128442 RepID=A0A6V8HIY0_TALPI|nr:hypothetical protein TCE0_042r14466 [Talaromyces pinophilus]